MREPRPASRGPSAPGDRGEREGHFAAPAAALCAVCASLFGCPQLADDRFSTVGGDVDANGGQTTFSTGNGGSAAAGGGSGGVSAGVYASRGETSEGRDASAGGEVGTLSLSCNDGWMNGDEVGVDCGGSCPTCACAGALAEPEIVTSDLGNSGSFYGPGVSLDNQTLYFSRASTDGDEDLYHAGRVGRGSAFIDAVAFGNINTTYLDGSPYVTPDGSTLYFFSDRPGGVGERDLWTATRSSANAEFGAAELLSDINSGEREHFPWLTPDRTGLFFASDRPGGRGGWDIWLAEKSPASGELSSPRDVTELNTGGSEQGMTLSRDGLTIIFASDRSGGAGDTDLWSATRPSRTGTFSAPVNLGQVNSSGEDDDPKLSNDGRELFFSSTRSGSRRLWHALRSCD